MEGARTISRKTVHKTFNETHVRGQTLWDTWFFMYAPDGTKKTCVHEKIRARSNVCTQSTCARKPHAHENYSHAKCVHEKRSTKNFTKNSSRKTLHEKLHEKLFTKNFTKNLNSARSSVHENRHETIREKKSYNVKSAKSIRKVDTKIMETKFSWAAGIAKSSFSCTSNRG